MVIHAIVLAAGRSQRLPPQKLLLPFDQRLVIGAVVDELLASDVDEVITVVGRDAARIRAALAGRAVRFVENPDPQSEMLDSVRCGLLALVPNCQAVVVALGDQPLVTRKVVNDLIDTFRASDKGIVVPTYGTCRGHPILVSRAYFAEILGGYDESGLRGLLAAHPHDIAEVTAPNSDVLVDMDTIGDYDRLRKRREE